MGVEEETGGIYLLYTIAPQNSYFFCLLARNFSAVQIPESWKNVRYFSCVLYFPCSANTPFCKTVGGGVKRPGRNFFFWTGGKKVAKYQETSCKRTTTTALNF